MPLLPFATGSHKGKSMAVDTEQLVNFFPELDQNGKSVVALYGTPGLSLLGDYGAFASRVLHEFGGKLYSVFRGALSSIDAAGVDTAKGTLNTTSGFVSSADNGTQLMIVDGTDGYIYNKDTDVFVTISDPDFTALSPAAVTHLDGFFIVFDSATEKFFISALNDGLAWDPLDFDSANQQPDPISNLIGDHGELWLMGERSIEVWSKTGNADFPFARLGGTHIAWGLAAQSSLTQFDDSIGFLGRKHEDGALQAIRINGFQPVRFSTDQVEATWKTYANVDDAVAYSYGQEGHIFFVISFPTAGKTWAFDSNSKEWHERSSGTAGERHLSNLHQSAFGENIVSDHSTGKLYKIRADEFTDNGAIIRGLIIGQHIHDSGERLSHVSLELDFEGGVGLDSGQGSDPQAMLRFSNDGGFTWSAEIWRAMGKIGEYRRRARWPRLGRSRDRVYQLSVSDPVKRVVIGMNLEVARSTAARGQAA